MKAVVFSFFSFFLLNDAVGIVTQDSSNLAEYQRLKYSAESAVLEGNYCLSTHIYSQLSDDHKLWNADLQNALLASLHCDDKESIERFAVALLERGAPHAFFENELDTFKFFHSGAWEVIKTLEIDFSFSPKLRLKILEMHDRDQRDRYDEENRPLDDYLNLIELNKIILNHGFPTEVDLGFDYYKGDLNYNRYFNNILLHLVKLQPWDFGQMIPKWYLDRKISPNTFIYLFAFTETCEDLKLTCMSQPASNVLFVDGVLFSCSENEIERINGHRLGFFLDSIEEQIKKVQFRSRNNRVNWAMDSGFSTFNYNERKYDFESISEKLLNDHNLVPYTER